MKFGRLSRQGPQQRAEGTRKETGRYTTDEAWLWWGIKLVCDRLLFIRKSGVVRKGLAKSASMYEVLGKARHQG